MKKAQMLKRKAKTKAKGKNDTASSKKEMLKYRR